MDNNVRAPNSWFKKNLFIILGGIRMKKKFLVSAVVLGVLSFSSVAMAATANPFTSVPKDHWAYGAVEKLVQAGLVDGYGDADFRGEKAITRYEMAELVAKAMANVDKADDANKAALDRLSTEYSDELANMGVRLAKVESKMSSFKWYGDARMRYQANYNSDIKENSEHGNSSRIQERVRLGFYGEPAENISVTGRIKMENTSHLNDGWGTSTHDDSGQHEKGYLDLFSVDWKNKDTKLSIGRQAVTLGQGIIWNDNPIDGIYVSEKLGKATVSAGWGDLTAENWKPYTMDAFLANVTIPIGSKTTFTTAMLKTNGGANNTVSTMRDNYGDGTWESPFSLEQYSVGFNSQLSSKVNLLVEGVTNKADDLPDNAQKNGWWSRLTYGNQQWNTANTYNVYLDYVHLGNYAVDSTGWGHILNTAGGNGYGNDGETGFGVGVSYMLAANTNLDVNYYKLKPYDENLSGFSKYKDAYNVSLCFSF